MLQSGSNLILEGGEINVASRVCGAIGFDLSEPLPTDANKDDIVILNASDFGVVFVALHKAADRSIFRPGDGIRRRDVLLSQYMLDRFFWQVSEPSA
jgi:hypothetical protein